MVRKKHNLTGQELWDDFLLRNTMDNSRRDEERNIYSSTTGSSERHNIHDHMRKYNESILCNLIYKIREAEYK
ncbi:hypothetical protein [Bacillus pseudomycoides]|uniref:hypothetical protein n=1 Tax=Bacillus pseudomycoides TaxID=64104 RepID=UPI001FB53C47|nr:hypothetical protein [Bacillus pseudomycoides]